MTDCRSPRPKYHRWSYRDIGGDECLDCGMSYSTVDRVTEYRSASGDVLATVRIGTPGVPPCTGAHSGRPIRFAPHDDSRPEGRRHIPIAYELDRVESIAARLRKENAQIKATCAQLRKELEENSDAVTKLQVENDRLRETLDSFDLERRLRADAGADDARVIPSTP